MNDRTRQVRISNLEDKLNKKNKRKLESANEQPTMNKKKAKKRKLDTTSDGNEQTNDDASSSSLADGQQDTKPIETTGAEREREREIFTSNQFVRQ
jgi:hypothetical protein